MSLREFFDKEYQSIAPNLKYDIYKYAVITLGAVMVGAVGLLVHRIAHAPEWAPYAAVFGVSFIGFLCFARLLAAQQVRYVSVESQQFANLERVPESPIAPPVDPKKPNLRVDVLDALFFVQRHNLSNNIRVLLHLRVVNHGEEEVVVTGWDLRIEVENDYIASKECPIEPKWQIRRNPINRPVAMEAIDRESSHFEQPLKRGVPKTRWICFDLTIISKVLPPYNGKFVLTLMDAFGNTHISEYGPAFIADTGEIVVV